MNLVFVHGRAQSGKDPEVIQKKWLSALEKAWDDAGIDAPKIDEVRLPFYGDVLDSWVGKTKAEVASIRERGGADADMDQLDPDDAELIQELLDAAHVSGDELSTEIAKEVDVVKRAPHNWEWFQAASRILEERAPWLADFGIDRFTADVGTYLKNVLAKDEVDQIVLSDLAVGECVVVAHSLGTVVAYHVLAHKFDASGIPLFMTLGSPLGISSIKRRLPSPLKYPKPPVNRWINASDERDFIALESKLAKSFVPGILDENHVDNGENAHSATNYLADRLVAKQIAEALGT